MKTNHKLFDLEIPETWSAITVVAMIPTDVLIAFYLDDEKLNIDTQYSAEDDMSYYGPVVLEIRTHKKLTVYAADHIDNDRFTVAVGEATANDIKKYGVTV